MLSLFAEVANPVCLVASDAELVINVEECLRFIGSMNVLFRYMTVPPQVEELEKSNSIKVKEVDDLHACVASLREENSQIKVKLQDMQSLKRELEL